MKLFLVIVFFVVIPVKSQTYLLKQDLIERDKQDFLGCKKEVFDETTFSFSLSSGDLASSLDAIEDEEPINLEKLKDSLAKDSLNFKTLLLIGEYYYDIQDKSNSHKYYNKALENINIKVFDNDSSSFYSTRSIVRFKIGRKGFIEDAELALSLDPNELISLHFYPIFLMSNAEFKKAKSILVNSLNNKISNPETWILYLVIINTMEISIELGKISGEPNRKNELIKKNYEDLFDWSPIRTHYDKLKDKQIALKLDRFLSLQSIILKMTLFEKNENDQIIFNFTRKEKRQIEKLEDWLKHAIKNRTLNEYTAYKCLGLVNFFLEDKEDAINYYQKAIQVYPRNKPNEIFDPTDVYTNLLFLYKYFDKNREYENLLLKKIADPQLKSFGDYINLSKFYLLEGDIEKARLYLEVAENIDPENFDVYRLKAHLGYIDRTEFIMEGFYLMKASRVIKNNSEFYRLFLQGAIYDMINDHPEEAYRKLSIIKENIKDCETCDRLLSTYFIIEDH